MDSDARNTGRDKAYIVQQEKRNEQMYIQVNNTIQILV
jgi:hypothetical protein